MTKRMITKNIKAGQQVHIKPEWQDPGDDKLRWFAVDDTSKGRVTITADLGLPINPTQVVNVEWLKTRREMDE